jgi:hypothetical protein
VSERNDFLAGVGVTAIGATLIIWAFRAAIGPNFDVRKEMALPKHCYVGEKVIMTSAPKAEYYECEAGWVRK